MGTPLAIAAQLLKTPTAQLAINGGSQHPDKRRGGGHGPTLADQVEWELSPHLLPTPTVATGRQGHNAGRSGERNGEPLLPSAVQPGRWGRYAAAIARWEATLGRPAPDATEPVPATKANVRACADDWGIDGWAATAAVRAGLWRGRLSPRFVEWMMGADEGTVTAVPGVSRSAQLARLGNGVVRQQAAAAVRILLPELAATVSA